jgi:LuxR family maltose regulon positive regulatory protein
VDRGLVPRTRIVTRCLEAIDTSIVLLTAPAGYGKTTVLLQWESADPRPFIWIGLDDRDNDPSMLVRSIAIGLDQIEPVDDGLFASLLSPSLELPTVAVPRLCDALNDRERSLVLVLDDLHHLRNAESLRAISAVAENMPAGSTLAIASREQPAMALGRMRAHRLLLELNTQDLAMTRSEAADLLEQAGLGIDPAGVEKIVERTEGWPVGLYLSALALADEQDLDAAIGNGLGDDRLVADYLRDEFIEDRPAAEVDFLVQTSILDRLSGSICDALLQRDDSVETLKALARSNQLVIPLDRRDREFRYHALLREMLEAELHRAGDKQQVELHMRASRWYAERGDVDRAVDHAIAGRDPETAGTLIWAATPLYSSGGRIVTLRRWLDRFSEQEIATSPALCLSRAVSQMTLGDGRGAERWTMRAVDGLKSLSPADAALYEASALLIAAAGAARDGVVRMREDVERANAILPEDNPWRAVCCLLEGAARRLTGDSERGRELLEDGARRAAGLAVDTQLTCLAQLALLALDEDDLEQASTLADRIVAGVNHSGLDDHPVLALAFAAAGLVDVQRGRPADAKRRVQLAERHIARIDIGSWYMAETCIVLARTLLRLDDVAGARRQLAEAARYMRGAADATVLRRWLERAWEDADAANAVTGRWPLTPAELRLLRVLPTHLSYPEIAEHFFVSSNTVKTHARSIYSKLGVSSRAEAVDCARQAGLLNSEDAGNPGLD